jgi:protein gp37
MAETKIEWANFVFNPWLGCQHVSEGCKNCYAEAMMDKRYGKVKWGPHGERVRTSDEYWKQPLRWAKRAREQRKDWELGLGLWSRHETFPRPRVFCASLADVFDNQVPIEWRMDLFRLIAATPELDWLLLTKRPENIKKMSFDNFKEAWPNVWLGTTCEDQPNFDHRWPILHKIPAAVRFISYEPAIGPLRLHLNGPHPDWLICGGESGRGHREMLGHWESDIRHDCKQAGVSYFFKQMAGKRPIPADFPIVRQFPKAAA